MCSSSTPSLPYAGVPGNGLEWRRACFSHQVFTDHHREDAPMRITAIPYLSRSRGRSCATVLEAAVHEEKTRQ
jgi:hypothetical protein